MLWTQHSWDSKCVNVIIILVVVWKPLRRARRSGVLMQGVLFTFSDSICSRLCNGYAGCVMGMQAVMWSFPESVCTRLCTGYAGYVMVMQAVMWSFSSSICTRLCTGYVRFCSRYGGCNVELFRQQLYKVPHWSGKVT